MEIKIENVKKGDIVCFKSYSLRVERVPVVKGNFVEVYGRTNVNGSPLVTKKFLFNLVVSVLR